MTTPPAAEPPAAEGRPGPGGITPGGPVLGVGVDLVDLAEFTRQLAEPGTRFESVLTPRERRQCAERAAGRGKSGVVTELAPHIATRWAAKEAVLKAWSGALYGRRDPLRPEELDWAEIEVVADAFGRPAVQLHGAVERAVAETVGSAVRWHLSLSHEAGTAAAFVVLSRE